MGHCHKHSSTKLTAGEVWGFTVMWSTLVPLVLSLESFDGTTEQKLLLKSWRRRRGKTLEITERLCSNDVFHQHPLCESQITQLSRHHSKELWGLWVLSIREPRTELEKGQRGGTKSDQPVWMAGGEPEPLVNTKTHTEKQCEVVSSMTTQSTWIYNHRWKLFSKTPSSHPFFTTTAHHAWKSEDQDDGSIQKASL